MRSSEPAATGYVAEGGELALDGAALLGLMSAALARGAPFRFRARGTSMDPFIHDGDVLTVVPLGSRRPEVGMVVAFVAAPPERVVVHRVVGRRGGGYMLRGDGAFEADGVVACSQMLGEVDRAERRDRPVRLGLGCERVLVALLSRFGLLVPAVGAARRWRGGLRDRRRSARRG